MRAHRSRRRRQLSPRMLTSSQAIVGNSLSGRLRPVFAAGTTSRDGGEAD